MPDPVTQGIRRGAAVFGFLKAWRMNFRARRKARKGEPLTTAEEILVAGETTQVIFPDGKVVERQEPIIKARTSTKAAVVGALVPLLGVIPFYDQVNALLLAACEAEHGPTVFLGGAGVAWLVTVVTARVTKSPAKPGKFL